MLSYRHAYHAGNFADILKHIIQVEILEYLTQKDKPFDYIDTHAGAGLYKLSSKEADKNREYENGIAKLKVDDFPELEAYLSIVKNSTTPFTYYPGSPKIAEAFLRPKDRAWLYELHPTDFKWLEKNVQRRKSIRLSQSDGYKGLIANVPPASKRALVMIDPSYERKEEYQHVINALTQAHKRFATGTYALWYPVVERFRIDRLEKALINSGIRRIQLFELGVQNDTNQHGMTAAGMIVINPPWTLMNKMQTLLPKLAETVSLDEKLHYRCQALVGE